MEQILILEMTLEPEPSNIEERKPEPEDNLYALRCDCYKSTCCYQKRWLCLSSYPDVMKMVIIKRMWDILKSSSSSPCECDSLDCCWLKHYPDDIKMEILAVNEKQRFYDH